MRLPWIDSKPDIDTLIKIIENNTDPRDSKYWQAILDLGENGKGNSRAIALLSQLCHNNNDEFIVMRAAESLYEIDPENPLIVITCTNIAKQSSHYDLVKEAVVLLGQMYNKVSENKDEIIKTLTHIIQQYYEKSVVWHTAKILGKIEPKNSIAIGTRLGKIEVEIKIKCLSWHK